MFSYKHYEMIIRNLIEKYHHEFPQLNGFRDRELTTINLSDMNRMMYADLVFGYKSDLYIRIQIGPFRFFILWYGSVKDFNDLKYMYYSGHYTLSKTLEVFVIQNLSSCTSYYFNDKYKLK